MRLLLQIDMSLLTASFTVLVFVYLFAPYLFCGIMKLVLWRYQFSSKPFSLFHPCTYADVILRVPLGLNMNLLIHIKQISVQIWPVVIFKLSGLSLNVLVKNEFQLWKDHQIELFKMLDDIRTRLKREGLLSAQGLAGLIAERKQDLTTSQNSDQVPQDSRNQAEFDESQPSVSQAMTSKTNRTRLNSRDQVQSTSDTNRTFFQRTIRNLLSSTMIELEETDLNLYLYKDQVEATENAGDNIQADEELQLDLQNIRKFHQIINRKAFLEKYLCLRINHPSSSIRVKAISDEDLDVEVKSVRSIIVNPCHPTKQGILDDITLVVNLPMSTKMLKFVGNYDISVKIKKAVFDINKKFIKKSLSFLIGASMLQGLIKVAKTIILKSHYHEDILKQEVESISEYFLAAASEQRDGNQQWPGFNQAGAQATFENYRDTAIPKRMKVTVIEGIDIITSDECKQLKPFLNQNGNEFGVLKLDKSSFELVRKIQNTYFIILKVDQAQLSINEDLESLQLKNFTQEVDFTLRKEITNLPVKRQKLQVNNKIQLENIHLNLSNSTLNYFLEFANIAKAMMARMSLSNKIKEMLLDDKFLQANVIQINHQKVGSDYEKRLLNIFKPLKFQDEISSHVAISNFSFQIERKHINFVYDTSSIWFNSEKSSVKHQSARSEQSANERAKLLQAIKGKFESLSFNYVQQANNKQTDLKVGNLYIFPSMLKPSSNQPAASPNLSLLAGKNLRYWSKEKNFQLKNYINKSFSSDKLQVNVNNEVFCDFAGTFVQFQIILKEFTNKWATKYKVDKVSKPEQIVVDHEYEIKDFSLIWCMSSSRFVNFALKNLKTVKEYFKMEDSHLHSEFKKYAKRGLNNVLHLKADEFKIQHYKYKDELVDQFYRCIFVPIEKQQIFLNAQEFEGDREQQDILAIQRFGAKWLSTAQKQSMRLSGEEGLMELPENFHFISMFYEIEKHIFHCRNYFNAHHEQSIKQHDFQHKVKYARALKNDIDQLAQQAKDSQSKTVDRDLKITIQVAKPEFIIKENNLKKVFSDKSDIAELLQQRGYLRVKKSGISNLWQAIQDKKLNDNYIHAKGRNFLMQYNRPKKYKNRDYLIDVIKSLDEGRDFITNQTFDRIVPGIHQFRLDYGNLCTRNIKKPLIEMWGFNWKQKFILAHLNPKFCEKEFCFYQINKIFQRFGLPKLFNALKSKFFYDMSICVERIKLNIQGQQSLLFFNDFFQQAISKFIYEDISRSRDPNKKYKSSLVGSDVLRERFHGIFKFSVLNAEINLTAKRDFSRQDSSLQINASDFILSQCYQQLYVAMRDFKVMKQPLAQFETLFIKFPVIELIQKTVYNDARDLDHYNHQKNVKCIEDYYDRLHQFQTVSRDTQIKFNLPSLGLTNQTQKRCVYMPKLMQDYAESSPIPFIHFQRSHMELFFELDQVFVKNRIDISGKVYRRMQGNSIGKNPRYSDNFQIKPIEKQRTKFQGFINDLVVVTSDFKDYKPHTYKVSDLIDKSSNEQDKSLELNLDEQILSPEDLADHSKKDQYLSKYNGMMLMGENLAVQSDFTYRPKAINYFEISDSLAQLNFIRLAKMTSKNLFWIRHPCFQTFRKAQFEKSLDNYSQFCQFFDINESKELRESTQSKLLQGYKLPPAELQENEMAIIENIHYKTDAQRKINFNSNMTYKAMLGGFKTLFPKYALTNEWIQRNLSCYSGSDIVKLPSDPESPTGLKPLGKEPSETLNLPRQVNISEIQAAESKITFKSAISLGDSDELQDGSGLKSSNYDKHESGDIMDDFIFSESDTIGTIIHTEYRQDQKIKYRSLRQDNLNRNRSHRHEKTGDKVGVKKLSSDGETIWVKHLIEIEGVRFLYTKKIHELLLHHIKGFDLNRFKRTDYIDEKKKRQQKNNDDDKKLLQTFENQKTKKSNSKAMPESAHIVSNQRLQKEVFVAVKLEQAQVNFQNNLTESQMLIASPMPVICTFFTYYKMKSGNTAVSLIQSQNNQDEIDSKMLGFRDDPLRRDVFSISANAAYYTGYRFSHEREVIKVEMEVGIRQMDCYVAPTFINLENPTFWMSQGVSNYKNNQQEDRKPSRRATKDFDTYSHDSFGDKNYQNNRNSKSNQNYHDFCQPGLQEEGFNSGHGSGENLLRKIILCNDISFNFEFLNNEMIDNITPKLKLDILAENLEGQLNSFEWWHFNQIIQQILLNRGERAAEVVLIEKWRAKELKRLNQEIIRDIIYSRMKNQYKEAQGETKPDLAKFVSATINSGKLRLFNQQQPMAQVDVKGVYGSCLIYANRESKQDLDIERITIENYLDGENYRWALSPLEGNFDKQYGSKAPQTMIQMRLKDKFIVVSEAPWHVVDHIELDIYPSSIQLTLNLYKQLKQFMFQDHRNHTVNSQSAQNESKQDEKTDSHDKKYELMVPTKHLVKTNKSFFSTMNTRSPKNPDTKELAEQDDKGTHANDQARALMLSSSDKVPVRRDSGGKAKDIDEKSLVVAFPVFFKYFRMNEINMSITYFHEKNSFLNSKDLNIKLSAFTTHYQFMAFKEMFVKYEKHCKSSFINQIPNILTQKFLKFQTKVDDLQKAGIGNTIMKGMRLKDPLAEAPKQKKKVKVKKDKADDSQSEYTDEYITDSDEEQKAEERNRLREEYENEIKQSKLKESRKLLFQDFAAIK